ncbi:hypothetical protein AIOL_001773 [Candidatus Rhodobacter oscarellae]|uniref:Peptidase n=1 Tax=Candidatus Rhodobacter oscarellae TaxID=1675527 RepID=A0A0J9E2A1_9RHOB|nr:hypothetical protein [Candidatus Rhodobacter lobularis]KMW56817.1 hypothetical protein AIOL_001773 [Candidatus Rhodobacter lobularis]
MKQRLKRWTIRLTAVAFGFVVAVNAAFALVIAKPGWAFPHSVSVKGLSIHAPAPLPEQATRQWARALLQGMQSSPIPLTQDRYDIYVTGPGWRYTLFFLPVRFAGGVVYPMNRRAVFLSGADFAADRLIKGQRMIEPPRTLTHYGRHELVHLAQMEAAGRLRYLMAEAWLREGLADYIALGPTSAQDANAIGAYPKDHDRSALRDAYGGYPEHRVRVTEALQTTDATSLWLEGG